MEHLTPTELIQLILDWNHTMKARGKRVGSTYDLSREVKLYHQVHRQGVPLSYGQAAGLRGSIRGFHIDSWAAEHYPALKGIAPPPPAPEPVEEEGFAFQSDDELDG